MAGLGTTTMGFVGCPSASGTTLPSTGTSISAFDSSFNTLTMPIFTLCYIGATYFNLLVVIKSILRYDKDAFELKGYCNPQNNTSDFETTMLFQL